METKTRVGELLQIPETSTDTLWASCLDEDANKPTAGQTLIRTEELGTLTRYSIILPLLCTLNLLTVSCSYFLKEHLCFRNICGQMFWWNFISIIFFIITHGVGRRGGGWNRCNKSDQMMIYVEADHGHVGVLSLFLLLLWCWKIPRRKVFKNLYCN